MQNANPDRLHVAIARNSAIVLSLPSAGMMRHYKSRFLAEEPDGIWVESVPSERPLIEELIATQQPVGISFKHEETKVMCLTPICRHQTEYAINTETIVPALLVKHPADLKEMQRRVNYRVVLHAGGPLAIRVWRIGPGVHLKDHPMAAQELSVQVRDVSVGGMGVIFLGRDGQPPRISDSDRLRIQLVYRDTSLLLEGQLRYAKAAAQRDILRAGVQFRPPICDMQGRQDYAKITRIVGELQRDEVRRFWLGAHKAG